jgi:hypothetical protein
MNLQKQRGRFDFGAYSVVFFLDGGRALKLFKRPPSGDEARVRRVFASEVTAFERAASCVEANALAPQFFGVKSVESVLDERGLEISHDFLLDCAYEMEFIAGTFIKLGALSLEKSLPVRRLFERCGIRYLSDASVTLSPEGEISRVIDFAIEEFEPEWDD